MFNRGPLTLSLGQPAPEKCLYPDVLAQHELVAQGASDNRGSTHCAFRAQHPRLVGDETVSRLSFDLHRFFLSLR